MKKERIEQTNVNTYVLIAGLLIIIASLMFYVYSPYKQATGMLASDSAMGNFTANIGTNIDCVWSDAAMSTSFGTSLTQGTNNYNASQNYNLTSRNETMYNVTIGSTTNSKVNITIKGADMESGINTIPVANIGWAANNTANNDPLSANATSMNEANTIALAATYNTGNMVVNNTGKGNVTWYRFWLDVPALTIAGDYTGNYTMQCSQY